MIHVLKIADSQSGLTEKDLRSLFKHAKSNRPTSAGVEF